MKLAVVTGGNRGLGREIGRQLAAQGVEVLVTAREPRAAEEAARALATTGARATAFPLDVTEPASVAALAAHVAAAHGGLDILVNNAGIALDGFDAEVARRTIDVNFHGPVRVSAALIPLLRAGGRVVMLSSGLADRSSLKSGLAAELVDPELQLAGLCALMDRFVADVAAGRHRAAGWPSSAYSVSKAGVNALTQVLARQLAADPRKLLVNAVCPGWVRTAMGGAAAPRSVEEGAETPVWAALLPEGGPQGGFFRDRALAAW